MLKLYLKRIFEVAKRGDAREESYYSCLEELLKNYADSINKKQTHITTLPKKTDAGNPDFRVWDGKQSIVGYIEAKQPAEENLLEIEHTEQLKKYLKTFPNLILTNFFEFRLYRDGHLIDKVQIARPYVIHKLGTIPPVEKEQDFYNLLERFFAFSLPKTFTAKTLAVELAKRTRFLKEQVIIQELKEEERNGKGFILGFYEAFSKYLIGGLTKDDFADLYSQTITYGLFAARTRTENGFNRKLAYDRIPKTIGILRDVFKFISLGDLPQQMEWIIDDISEVLAVTDVYKILDEYFHKHKGKDPIVHFYETFLAEYDPKTREKRGVYYTPEPVVSYIVRSLHRILKEHFNKKDGFADTNVTVLDPAAGTLTFLAEATKLAVEKFTSNYGDGAKEMFIKEHILKNFYAFELMMAPYAIGHLKMSFLLEELGYKLQTDDRFKLYLTNTLEMDELAQTELPGMASLSEESHLAGNVKKEMPILVILGNPPYSGHSTNVGEWISNEIKAYFQVDGKSLGEKNPKWLQDDYVKFIRFSQWKIEQAGGGVLGLITNHSYLDNPTFRGMRQSLMKSFDEIYLLDLHGNSLKKEKCPDGSKDDNVFDIQQGVAIALFIKRIEKKEEPLYPFRPSPQMGIVFEKVKEEKPKKHQCKVHHTDVWGNREFKYAWLTSNDVKTTKWKKIKPKSGFYLFIPRDERLLKQYEKYPRITDIFPVNSVGIVTSRDDFVIDFDRDVLRRRILQLRDKKLPDEIIQQTYNLKDKSTWELKDARKNVMKDDNWEQAITKVLYRPFDEQWIFYHDAVIERARKEVMQHMMSENLGLITVRQVAECFFNHAFVTNSIIESRITLSNKGIGFLFPLYFYIETKKPKNRRAFGSTFMLFEPGAPYTIRKPNISESIIQRLSSTYGKQPAPEEIFFYIYAVLYSNIYRTKYAEFLKIDFPRIPFTKDYKLFKKMGEYGEHLVDLHLMKSTDLEPPIASFYGKGDNRVEKLRYDQGKLYINNDQYFEGIASEIREYQIGGYQVCEKWLKDRKERVLSLDEIKHYCMVVTALKKTIEVQGDIDNIYPDIEKKIKEICHES
ncbi:MAG: DNA methyltransferase [Thermodesulfovibrio sp. RBG_19FT_COMBO_42_12]|nr:MAG: DNA methyltransferase [Thermodesulfovibrio sp. RBG_19FT_COMBO_42_12]